MAKILNKKDQRLLINLKSGRTIDLLARGTADVQEEDLLSSHLRNLAAKGDIIVSRQQMPENKEVIGVAVNPAKEGKKEVKKQVKKEGKK